MINPQAQKVIDRIAKTAQNYGRVWNEDKVLLAMKEYYRELGVQMPKEIIVHDLILGYKESVDAARGAAWDAAWGADDLLVSDLQGYKEKYPNGSFLNLIPLYEMGLWPIGVVDGKFIVAIPASKLEFPDIV